MKPTFLLWITFITLVSSCSSVKSPAQKSEAFYTPKNWQEPLKNDPAKSVEALVQQVVEPEKMESPPPVVEPEKMESPPPVVEPEKMESSPPVVEPKKMEEAKLSDQMNGLAYWYDLEFTRELTTSGENYDQDGLTAAHNSLPVDTWVEVTNLQNDKTVVVRVNDRRPKNGDYVIGLTKRAATQLGFLEQGTAPVSLRIVEPPVAIETPAVTEYPMAVELPVGQNYDQVEGGDLFVVQLIVLKSEVNAYSFQRKLAARYSALTFLVEGYKDNTYRVFVGPYESKARAKEIASMLKSDGVDTFVQGYEKYVTEPAAQ